MSDPRWDVIINKEYPWIGALGWHALHWRDFSITHVYKHSGPF